MSILVCLRIQNIQLTSWTTNMQLSSAATSKYKYPARISMALTRGRRGVKPFCTISIANGTRTHYKLILTITFIYSSVDVALNQPHNIFSLFGFRKTTLKIRKKNWNKWEKNKPSTQRNSSFHSRLSLLKLFLLGEFSVQRVVPCLSSAFCTFPLPLSLSLSLHFCSVTSNSTTKCTAYEFEKLCTNKIMLIRIRRPHHNYMWLLKII